SSVEIARKATCLPNQAQEGDSSSRPRFCIGGNLTSRRPYDPRPETLSLAPLETDSWLHSNSLFPIVVAKDEDVPDQLEGEGELEAEEVWEERTRPADHVLDSSIRLVACPFTRKGLPCPCLRRDPADDPIPPAASAGSSASSASATAA